MTDTVLDIQPYPYEETLSHKPSPFMLLDGINPLVSAAMPLILLLIKLKDSQTVQQGINQLRREVVAEIIAFTNRAHDLQCSPRLILAARYCLCTALDEVILSTSWGNAGTWANQTLLSTIQKETWGGERFFIILEEMAKAAKENLPLLELQYILLSLGFEGKYFDQEQTIRDEIRHRLFHVIMQYREEPHKALSPSFSAVKPIIEIKQRWLTKWKLTGMSAAILMAFTLVMNFATYLSARQILNELTDVTIPAFSQDTKPIKNTTEKPARHYHSYHHYRDFSGYQ